MKRSKLIVFDMDGVLVDVSRSYREAVRKTARLFFRGAFGFENIPDPIFSLADLAVLKQSGGLNNDWDLTAQAIHLLFAPIKTPSVDLLLQGTNAHAKIIQRYDVSPLADFLKKSTSPLMELYAKYGGLKNDFVAKCFIGDVGTGNLIKRMFQEIYLGPPLFNRIYGLEPRYHCGNGLIDHESLLMKTAILEALSIRYVLSIATGRPKAEADYTLDRFRIGKYFEQVITLDDCIREEKRILNAGHRPISLQKPNPYMLDLIPRLIGRTFDSYYYIGDMPDDMQAARSSRNGFHGLGTVIASPEPDILRKQLMQAGAEAVIDNYSVLHEVIG